MKLLDELAFLTADHGGFDHNFTAFGHKHYPVGDFVHRLTADFPTAFGAMRYSDASEKQSEIIVYFSYGSYGGARVVRRGFLVYRNCGRKPVDKLDVGFVHLTQKLAGVRRQAFDIPPLPLGKNRIESERGFTASRKSRKHG